ncbi:hypothetical protein PHYNN_156 [Pantoea phage Phynn]|nr:hypothetical protein PHYNN_156 [Pantoea phage Phynn]
MTIDEFNLETMPRPISSVVYKKGMSLIDRYAKIGVVAIPSELREFFWVRVKSFDVRTSLYRAEVNNDLVRTDLHGLKDGDIIAISEDNISIVMN